MDIGNYREMDPYMLLSIINLKLRDYYSDIEDLKTVDTYIIEKIISLLLNNYNLCFLK